MLWQYIGANFAESPRAKFRELLGYSTTQVSSRLCPAAAETEGVTAEVLAEKMADLGTGNVSVVPMSGGRCTIHVVRDELDLSHTLNPNYLHQSS